MNAAQNFRNKIGRDIFWNHQKLMSSLLLLQIYFCITVVRHDSIDDGVFRMDNNYDFCAQDFNKLSSIMNI